MLNSGYTKSWLGHGPIAIPVDVVSHLLPTQPNKSVRVEHQPAMPWRDIPAFVQKLLRTAQQYDVTRSVLEFLILTACRSGEVRAMKWSEVDLELPAKRMKATCSVISSCRRNPDGIKGIA